MTRRRKCGGRAGRRLVTPRATGTRLGRIRAPRPAPSLSAPSSSAFLLPFLRFSPLQRALRSTGKFSQDPGEDIHEMWRGSGPTVRRWGWRSRLLRGLGARGTAAAAPAATAPTAARASRAGYINTRFHTPELTSAGPAQPRAGGGRERRAGGGRGPGRREGPASANRVRRVQRGALTQRRPGTYGRAAPDSLLPLPTPLPPRSLPSPPSPPSLLPSTPLPPPRPSSARRVLPGSVRNCFWRSRGRQSQPMGSGETRRLARRIGRDINFSKTAWKNYCEGPNQDATGA
ncbi:uncharacterized protein [Castor canadensis]|uniref:Uncharacterized protein n=1 Tax=Castor canadensis TaxID=51338 RepID=A0AC58KTZ9_CASCN